MRASGTGWMAGTNPDAVVVAHEEAIAAGSGLA